MRLKIPIEFFLPLPWSIICARSISSRGLWNFPFSSAKSSESLFSWLNSYFINSMVFALLSICRFSSALLLFSSCSAFSIFALICWIFLVASLWSDSLSDRKCYCMTLMAFRLPWISFAILVRSSAFLAASVSKCRMWVMIASLTWFFFYLSNVTLEHAANFFSRTPY
jgi:hypothetical protein